MSDGWTPSSPCAPPTAYLPLAGGTMTGPLILAADPVQRLEAVTKQYADAIIAVVEDSTAIGDNRIINGDMRIDQRNNGASGTANSVYTIDRWYYSATQTAKITWQRITASSAAIGASGFGYNLLATSSSAYTVAAGDTFNFRQPIEADLIVDFAWGTANAQPVTLSFLAQSSLTGAFGGALANNSSSATRSYPFTFSIPVASTWTKIAITIPGDTAGTWNLQGNGVGASLFFDLGTGATYRGPANAWASANYVGASGSVSLVATNGATFQVTGVKLEIGSVATPFNRQSLAKSMADCQRYFQTITVQLNMYGQTGWGISLPLPVQMRAAPTITPISWSTQTNCSGSTVAPVDNGHVQYTGAITASGLFNSVGTQWASAEL